LLMTRTTVAGRITDGTDHSKASSFQPSRNLCSTTCVWSWIIHKHNQCSNTTSFTPFIDSYHQNAAHHIPHPFPCMSSPPKLLVLRNVILCITYRTKIVLVLLLQSLIQFQHLYLFLFQNILANRAAACRRLLAWYCRPSVRKCIVAKWYLLQWKCLNKSIENAS